MFMIHDVPQDQKIQMSNFGGRREQVVEVDYCTTHKTRLPTYPNFNIMFVALEAQQLLSTYTSQPNIVIKIHLTITNLIVDFPHQRFSIRAVHFAETAELHVFERPKVARSELWYTRAEYAHMALRRREDILALRAGRTSLLEAADVDVDDDPSRREFKLHGNRASSYTSKHERGQVLQSKMYRSGSHRAGKTRSLFKNGLGDYCVCIVGSNKES